MRFRHLVLLYWMRPQGDDVACIIAIIVYVRHCGVVMIGRSHREGSRARPLSQDFLPPVWGPSQILAHRNSHSPPTSDLRRYLPLCGITIIAKFDPSRLPYHDLTSTQSQHRNHGTPLSTVWMIRSRCGTRQRLSPGVAVATLDDHHTLQKFNHFGLTTDWINNRFWPSISSTPPLRLRPASTS